MREQDLIKSVWTGSAFEPDGNWAFAQCNDRLGEGQVVYLDLDPERSKRSHNHQFAFVGIALENLPEHLVSAPFARNADTLRKHALCMTGFCDTNMVALGTEARAERVAAVGTSVEISPDDARQLARLMDANLSTAKAALIESRKTYAKARQTLADSEKNLVVALILYVSTAAIFISGAFQ